MNKRILTTTVLAFATCMTITIARPVMAEEACNCGESECSVTTCPVKIENANGGGGKILF